MAKTLKLKTIPQSEILRQLREARHAEEDSIRARDLRRAAASGDPTPEEIQAAAGIEAVSNGPGIYIELASVHPEFPRGDYYAETWLVFSSVPLTRYEIKAILRLGTAALNGLRAAAAAAGKRLYLDEEGECRAR